jgi:hypothetical protein
MNTIEFQTTALPRTIDGLSAWLMIVKTGQAIRALLRATVLAVLYPLAGAPTADFIQKREAGVSSAPAKDDLAPIGAAFEQWHMLPSAQSPDREPPCIIVAAEGDGIRAVLWPALVLGTLQDSSLERRKGQPDFASHVLAISGVSGGSVGAAVFAALCAEQRESGKLRERAATICGSDPRAPTLGALLYSDFVQRFLPVAFLPDRAAAFEHSWERAWPNGSGSNRLEQQFSALWPTVCLGARPFPKHDNGRNRQARDLQQPPDPHGQRRRVHRLLAGGIDHAAFAAKFASDPLHLVRRAASGNDATTTTGASLAIASPMPEVPPTIAIFWPARFMANDGVQWWFWKPVPGCDWFQRPLERFWKGSVIPRVTGT